MQAVVFTVDQRSSRTGRDLVPETLDTLAALPVLRAFERTAGDEIQGLLDDPATTAECVALLVRADAWNIGIGVGSVETPLPPQARAGSGEAYFHARKAVNRAKQVNAHLSVVGADVYRAEQLETVLWLWADLLRRRTDRGWAVADLISHGLSHTEAATRLGISQSAVSQRARAAGVVEANRAARLAGQLVDEMLKGGDR